MRKIRRAFRFRNWRFLRIARGLRFRLALSFLLFFALVLVAIGLISRGSLRRQLEGVETAALDEEWNAVKGYLTIRNFQPQWEYDRDDSDEDLIVSRLKQVYFVADSNGNAIDTSDIYDSLGADSPDEVRRILSQPGPVVRTRYDRDGVPYLVKSGALIVVEKKTRQRYFLSIGRSLQGARNTIHEFTRNYFYIALPLVIVICSTLGWLIAGRAIRPVNLVAQAAQSMTGSNLERRISRRGAGDELDNLIESFNRMSVRLQQSFEQIRRFSTDVSHELRTPLTAIRGQLEVAVFTAQTPEQYREAVINALEDVEKLSSIVRTLLLLSQAESGQLALQKTEFDLADLAIDVVDQFQIPAEGKNISLTADLSHGALVSADHTQIERLLSNLLSNSIKYTPAGGKVKVRAGLAEELGWAQLVVEDTGIGIPEENLPHIFDRFYRVRNAQTSSAQGLGLGLSFVSWIVEVHGGRIDVVSKEGEGSRFRALLPLSVAVAEPLAESSIVNNNP